MERCFCKSPLIKTLTIADHLEKRNEWTSKWEEEIELGQQYSTVVGYEEIEEMDEEFCDSNVKSSGG